MDAVGELCPASSSILVVLSSPVVGSCYASVMEVVGWVGWVHYPRSALGEQVTILVLVVVPFPVDANIFTNMWNQLLHMLVQLGDLLLASE